MEAQPMETLPDEGVVLARRRCDGEWVGPRYPRYVNLNLDLFDAWCPLPSDPQPDPMTVVARHPMDTLPDGHPEKVVIGYASGAALLEEETTRTHDTHAASAGWVREWWCPLAPLLDLIAEERTHETNP